MKKLKDILSEAEEKEDKLLWKNKYLQVYDTSDGYTYVKDMGGRFVAVLVFDTLEDAFLGRYERVPPHKDGIQLVALTGKVEEDEDPMSAAVRELKEESGFEVEGGDLITLGTIRSSKMTDSWGYLYAVGLKGELKEGEIYRGPGDGTVHEEEAYCKRVPLRYAALSKDPILATMYARLCLKGLVD